MIDRKPRILVTGPVKDGNAMWWLTRSLIALAGGDAIHFDERKSKKDIPEFDGLVLGGGHDLDPSLYGEKPLPGIEHNFDPRQDEDEMKLLRSALDRARPVVGVCRGIQVINVYFGGSLHQDISPFFPEGRVKESRLPFKKATIEKGSSLGSILSRDIVPINSMHTQAVKEVAAGLKAVAWEENGLVQGLEASSGLPILAVQWHPEFMPYFAESRRYYQWIVDQAKKSS
jgi:putative glutamine amidotransferase